MKSPRAWPCAARCCPILAILLGLEERLLYLLTNAGRRRAFGRCSDRDSDQLYHIRSRSNWPVQQERERVPGAGGPRAAAGCCAPGLVDRTRLCSGCGSAHIHFVDVCPHCQSLDTRRESMLHCFACWPCRRRIAVR